MMAFAIALTMPMLLSLGASLDNLRSPIMPLRLIPHWTLENYKYLLSNFPVWRWIFNSMFIAGAAMLVNTILSLLAGFAFEKKEFRGKETLYYLVLVTLAVPGTMLILPNYLVVKNLGLVNTYWGLILPSAVSASMIYFSRNYFRGFPNEYLDEAQMLGLSEARTFFRIVLPISGPVVALAAIQSFLAVYHNYMWQLLMIRDDKLMTINLGMQQVITQYVTLKADGLPAYSLTSAGTVLSFIPIVLIFILFQKRFIGGFYGPRGRQ